LKAEIARLQKQLAALQVQMAHASAGAAKNPGAATELASLQGEASTIEAAIQQAGAALAALMLQSGQSTGLINDQA
jgi:uncharacterized protein with PhoU and TrkA domain